MTFCFTDNPNVIKFPEDAPCSKEGNEKEREARSRSLVCSSSGVYSGTAESKQPEAAHGDRRAAARVDAARPRVGRGGNRRGQQPGFIDIRSDVCFSLKSLKVWEEFRRLRVAELPEDPDERRKRINKILSFVSRGKDEEVLRLFSCLVCFVLILARRRPTALLPSNTVFFSFFFWADFVLSLFVGSLNQERPSHRRKVRPERARTRPPATLGAIRSRNSFPQ